MPFRRLREDRNMSFTPFQTNSKLFNSTTKIGWSSTPNWRAGFQAERGPGGGASFSYNCSQPSDSKVLILLTKVGYFHGIVNQISNFTGTTRNSKKLPFLQLIRRNFDFNNSWKYVPFLPLKQVTSDFFVFVRKYLFSPTVHFACLFLLKGKKFNLVLKDP